MQIQYLDGPRLRRSLIAACDYAQRHRGELNRINVFPVPDGDTGTNLALTVRSIADHLRGNRDRSVSAVANAAAQGAVLGARGNCGMMLSHFLLGFADDLGDEERVDAERFGSAMRAGGQNLYDALEQPVEGTILTVIRDSANAAVRDSGPDFVPLLESIVAEARGSLARTPELLPALRKAGVVDAGAKGFVSLLEGVLLFINGDPIIASEGALGDSDLPTAVADAEYPTDEEQFRYCTEALVRGSELPGQKEVRAVLREMGDSLIVIRSDDVLKVHVHTDEPEDVFAYLRRQGELVTHKAEDMRAQHATVERAASGHVALARRPVSIVADSTCDLPEEVVRAHGIHVTPLILVDGDETYRDGIDMTADEFHQRLADDGVLPTTSQPAPADFMRSYTRAAEEGEAVVGVLCGSTLSGTFGSGEAAATRFDGAPVYLADSLGASLLTGLLVLKATELAELAWDPQDIVDEVQRIRERSGIYFTVETFDRIVASGRVGKGRAFLGRMLGVKPILGLTADGKVEPAGKAIGSVRARAELMRIVREQIPVGAKVRFGVVHVGVPDLLAEVVADLRSAYGKDVEVLTSPVTPVIATHLGIGAWGIAYIVED